MADQLHPNENNEVEAQVADQLHPKENNEVEAQVAGRFKQDITPQDVDNMIVDSASKTTADTTRCHIRILKGKH